METYPISTRLSQVSQALPAHQLPPKAPNISDASKEYSNLQARDCSPSSSRTPNVGPLPTHTEWLLRSPSSASSSWTLSSRGLQSLSSPSSVGPPAYNRPYQPHSYPSLPTMGVSVMSNIHQPDIQTPRIHGMDMPQSGYHHMMHRHGQPPPKSERPFKCDQCVQSFSRNHDLKRHKRIHLAVKPFPCTLCCKSFSRKDALKRHRLVKGCGTTSEKRKEDSEPEKNGKDILTKDCKPRLHMCTDNQLPQPDSVICSSNNSPFPTTSRGQEPPSQDGIQLPRVMIKTEQLADTVETLTIPSSPNSSQAHALSEGLECRVSSQTPYSDISSTATESFIDTRKSQIVDSIVFNVAQWLRSMFDACRKNAGGNSSGTSGTSQALWSSHSKAKSSNSIKPSNEKGKLMKRDDCETDEEEEDGHREDRQSNDRSIRGNENAKFACPYFKYNPAKYKDWRICPGPGWDNVHRIKEHLYRRHRQPQYRCGRCWQPFTDEQCLFNHQRTDEPCPLRDMEHVEGFDAAQEKSLKSRKRPNPELSETEKWKRVYKILFPHVLDDDIPSPFYEYDHISQKEDTHQHSESDYLTQCEDYMVREVPQRLRQALGRELDRDLTIVEENLRRKAGDWVKTLLEEAFRELRQNRRPGSPSQRHGANDGMPAPTEENSLPLALAHQPHSSENSNTHFEGESESWLSCFDLDSFDPFTILGETEFSFDNGGLLENLLQPEEGGDGEEKKQSDSGYGSNSPTQFEK